MHSTTTAAAVRDASRRTSIVGYWLWCVAALVFAMVLVGGATRLTESGLSIVEWQPVAGTIPPLGDAAWQAEFDKYKAIPQYQRLNRGMSLDDFKSIYWWEWGHRLLGRLIGVAVLLPSLWFLWRGFMDRRLGWALGGIFMLGAVQGAVGWWMVASGLTERVNVSQYRLAFHLTLACIIYAALVWTAEWTFARVPGRGPAHEGAADGIAFALPAPDGAVLDGWPLPFAALGMGDDGAVARGGKLADTEMPTGRIASGACALLGLVGVQIYFGALVAGLRAGLIYNTWPLIDGRVIPTASDLFFDRPWWRNFFENTLTVQFDHRMLAYALGALALLHFLDISRRDPKGSLADSAGLVFYAILGQALIGVVTLLHAAPIALAMLHQAMALIVLTAATVHAARVVLATRSRPRLAAGVPA